jgi:hypothetical protein
MRAPTSALALLMTSALLVGCSGSDSDSSSSATGMSADNQAADNQATGGQPADSEAGGTTAIDLRVAPGDAVIRTAELAVRVDDVGEAADDAGRLARAAGGRVESEDRSGDGSGRSASVQLRVPPPVFDEAVAALVVLGDERSRRLGTEDVSEQVADLDARLATQRASVARVRALLDEADALGEVVQIESELTKRTADLEALQARLAALEAQVDLSTIVVRFDSEGGPVVGDALGFGDGLSAGWSALAASARVLAVTAGALLPFVPLLLVAAWFAVRARSRRTAAAAR